MLTPNDIRNPERTSGYDHVAHMSKASKPRKKPYQANVYGGNTTKAGHEWFGPARATAAESAQDYCDYMNGKDPWTRAGTPRKPQQPRNIGSITVSLASAGHRARKASQRVIVREHKARQRSTSPGYVYLIGEEGLPTFVKVGYSKDATLRIGSLQTGNPRKLIILGVIRGTEADERELHAEFIDQNVLGEWFRPTPALLSEFDVEPEMIA